MESCERDCPMHDLLVPDLLNFSVKTSLAVRVRLGRRFFSPPTPKLFLMCYHYTLIRLLKSSICARVIKQ